MRRSIFALVKFLSRLFTALNLLPSIATLTSANKPTVRQSMMNRAHTLRMAPLVASLQLATPPNASATSLGSARPRFFLHNHSDGGGYETSTHGRRIRQQSRQQTQPRPKERLDPRHVPCFLKHHT